MALDIKIEKVEDVWEDLHALARMEHDEVEVGWRDFNPDWDSMKSLNRLGTFQVLTARIDGRMIGYLTWFVDFDIESKGTLIVNQAAWYVEPGHPIVGVKMFDRAIQEFRRIGVKFAYLHHTNRGRGASLGRFFNKRGAEPLGYTYILKVK
jgi:hypothetical protein